MEQSLQDMLEANEFIEVQDWLLELERQPRDADFDPKSGVKATLKIDAPKAALTYVQTYMGTCDFMGSLKSQLLRKGSLTPRQCRAALKIMQDDLKSGKMMIARKHDQLPAAPLVVKPTVVEQPEAPKARQPWVPPTPKGCDYKDETQGYIARCDWCWQWFKSFEDVMVHKTIIHDKTGRYNTDPDKQVPVLAGAERSVMDLSNLPDGRYAVPHPTSRNGFRYFHVNTIKRAKPRSKKYRWSKYNVGNEFIPVGTIEVREGIGDTKGLVGEQKPGEGYVGEYIDQLAEVMTNPKGYAMLYSTMIGSCNICGKTLTDDFSRRMGIGPECEKQWGDAYYERWNRDKAVQAAQAASQ